MQVICSVMIQILLTFVVAFCGLWLAMARAVLDHLKRRAARQSERDISRPESVRREIIFADLGGQILHQVLNRFRTQSSLLYVPPASDLHKERLRWSDICTT